MKSSKLGKSLRRLSEIDKNKKEPASLSKLSSYWGTLRSSHRRLGPAQSEVVNDIGLETFCDSPRPGAHLSEVVHRVTSKRFRIKYLETMYNRTANFLAACSGRTASRF